MSRSVGSRSLRPDEVAVVEQLWQTHTDEQIAERLDRGHKTITALRKRMGWLKPRQKSSRQLARESYDDRIHADQVRAMQSVLSRRFA